LSKNKTILIVDDEESIRVSLENILCKKYFTGTAKSGSIALEMLQNANYDLILTDIKMPDMSGIELLKRTKKIFPEILVLLMTGFSSLETAIEAMRLGGSDYLIKPCSKKTVFESISRCFEKSENIVNNEHLTQYFQNRIITLTRQKPLTKRELEIFNYLILGMSDKRIAEKLVVTLPTVKFHLQNIYKKSGVNGRKGILKIISSYRYY
jgi:DNA-binding NarL/FixJ family response regulator